VRALGRDELKRACGQHSLDERGRSRDELARRIIGACQAINDSRAPSSAPAFVVCLDDDAQGRPLEALWELELGASILVDGSAEVQITKRWLQALNNVTSAL
jgi:hypothetical protein